jgi:hypothetical protein
LIVFCYSLKRHRPGNFCHVEVTGNPDDRPTRQKIVFAILGPVDVGNGGDTYHRIRVAGYVPGLPPTPGWTDPFWYGWRLAIENAGGLDGYVDLCHYGLKIDTKEVPPSNWWEQYDCGTTHPPVIEVTACWWIFCW